MLKNMRQLDQIPHALNTGIFKSIFEKAIIDNLNKTQRAMSMYNGTRREEIEFESTLQYKIPESEAKSNEEITPNLLQNTDHSHKEIAKLVGVTLKEVV